MVEVTVARLGIDSATNSYVVILRERGGRRVLPIWIGKPEAESIVMEMNQVTRERPLTHDLCKSLVVALGGTLQRVSITRVHQNTYFAELQLTGSKGVLQMDARPSDGIALALRLHAPIFAQSSLLTVIVAEDDADEAEEGDDGSGDLPLGDPPGEELSPEELKAYLETLRPEDFGKFSP